MSDFVRGIQFDLTNRNKKRVWYSVYAYESLEQPGVLVYEVTPNKPGKSKATPQNLSKLFFNAIDGLEFNDLGSSPSSSLGYNYNLVSLDESDFTFVVSNSESNLTLESITSIYPGKGGFETLQPFAPLAVDDNFYLFEDGVDNLQSPSHFPVPNILDVLENDTDENGYSLSIESIIEEPLYGKVEIVDADNDGLGDFLSYTPSEDLSLDSDMFDEIKYFVSNGKGGTDFATASISLAPVADVPDISAEVDAGDSAEKTRIRVFAKPTDKDQSESITSINLTSDLPYGVTIESKQFVAASSKNFAYRNYIITTDLDSNPSYDFTLDFEATSTESLNGDTETNIISENIVLTSSRDLIEQSYLAKSQSMWNTGDAETLDWSYTVNVIDIDLGDSDNNFLYEYDFDAELEAGLQFYLDLSAGEVSAESLYEINLSQNYNKTTDQLEITPTATLKDAFFDTIFANGKLGINFVYDYYLNLQADNGDLEDNPKDNIVSAGPVQGDGSLNLFEINTNDLGGELEIPETPLTIEWEWPQLEIESKEYKENTNTINGGYRFEDNTGVSDNFLSFNLDIDELIVQIMNKAGIPVPQEVISGEFGPFEYQLFDIDLGLGLNLVQSFEMMFDELTGVLIFDEANDNKGIFEFNFGETLIFDNALSTFDANDDGLIDYSISSAPVANLDNDTGIGLNFFGSVEGPSVSFSDEAIIGPFGELGFSETPTSFSVFDKKFNYDFDESLFNVASPTLLA